MPDETKVTEVVSKLDDNLKVVDGNDIVKDNTEPLDPIVDALAKVPNSTAYIQSYLETKRYKDETAGALDVLQDANNKLREELAKKEVELRETRRALNGRIPAVIEVIKEVERKGPVQEAPKQKELSIEEIRQFFNTD